MCIPVISQEEMAVYTLLLQQCTESQTTPFLHYSGFRWFLSEVNGRSSNSKALGTTPELSGMQSEQVTFVLSLPSKKFVSYNP